MRVFDDAKWNIVCTYPSGECEIIDTAESLGEARYVCEEFRKMYGPRCIITIDVSDDDDEDCENC